ncbi:HlyC/CorC family transporter [Paracoccus suum]|uniref:HlyC/CorC family transporter n=1 Tax=Paracoccus suum TaxID=2259340 RepID=A0A344PJR0_9RHOB|nr:hemolysin family protein [Paracoccus suum]AXC49615.1 HlyC/CorC family transporter [Paracoccus suum]
MSDDRPSPAAAREGSMSYSESPTDDPASSGEEGREVPSSRGFLGRLLGAFSGDVADETAPDDIAPGSGATAPGIQNLLRLRVDDVAVPKSDIVAASVESALDDILQMFRDHGFSRLPVYRGTLDTPLGLIHMKDLALKYGFGAEAESPFEMRPMLRPLLYVPPSMPIGVLLQQMQQKRIHMALVIDEYGGVDGLITLEDLVEQVIGEIEDEHDELETGHWVVERPGQWLVDARADLHEIEAATGLRLAIDEGDEEVDTLGGLIGLIAGRVPAPGEVVTHPGGARFEIVEGDPRRLKRLRLRFPGTPDTPRRPIASPAPE